MHIVDLLKQSIEQGDFFFDDSATKLERYNLTTLAREFLGCENDRHRETLAILITNYALIPHGKGHEIAPIASIMNMFELFEPYEYKLNRKHMVHQVYTFLLGLLLYQRIEQLRDWLNEEMLKTTEKLSSGSAKGEFLFRWRLSSLCHDLGNGISLFGSDAAQIDKYLFYLQLLGNDNWDGGETGVNKLIHLNFRQNALDLLDGVDRSSRTRDFYDRLRADPFQGIYFDHGLVSALILLKLLDRMYFKCEGQVIYHKGHLVSFDPEYFDKSIVRSAYAIALHNLDFYPDLYGKIWGTERIYDAEKRPLVFLLKLCDTLQEWYKPRVSDESDYHQPTEIEVEFHSGLIAISKFPDTEKLRAKLDRFFETKGLVLLENAEL